MPIRALLGTASFFVFGLIAPLRAQLNHNFDPSNPSNPYNLTDLDNFSDGAYAACRWGVWQSMTSNGDATLKFDWLTAGTTQQELETDLFLTSSLQNLTCVPFASLASRLWTPSTGLNDGSVHIKQTGWDASSGPFPTLHLLRRLHFRNYLEGPKLFDTVPSDAKKLIILIHRRPTGWQ